MAGLKGQQREPKGDPRERRNAQNLSSAVRFLPEGGTISLNTQGEITLNLATDPGLEEVSGLRVKIKTDGGITRDSDGLSGTTATTTVRGIVLQAAAIADLNQTITDPPTQAEVQAISDKIDALLAALRTAGLLAT